MLNDQEQRVWDDVQRFWAETAEEPARSRPAAASPHKRAHRGPTDAPWWAVGGAWVAIFMVLFGAVAAGLAVGVATVLGWALWRLRPQLTQRDTPSTTLPVPGEVSRSRGATWRPMEEPWQRRLGRRADEQR